MTNIGLLLLRVVAGLTVSAHGSRKLFGWFGGPGVSRFATHLHGQGLRPSRVWALIGGLAECAGGLAVAAGFMRALPQLH